MYATVDDLTAGGQLISEPATDWEIGRWWTKANEFRQASERAAAYRDTAFLLGYISAIQAATAIVRAGGYRARGRALHHNTFAGAVALTAGRLRSAGATLDRLGRIYDLVSRGEADASPEDLARLRDSSAKLFQECRIG